jgi:protocatechuate 3,4-dioxygenase beta subunit
VHLRQLVTELAVAPGTSATTHLAPAAPAPTDAAPAPAPDAPAVRGTVRDATGRALDGAVVAVTDADGRQLGRAVADAAGRFAVEVPRTGRYLLIGSADGHRPHAATVPVTDQPADVTVELAARGALTGAVCAGTEGVPLADAVVTVTDAEGRRTRATTDAAGRFRFVGLAPGGHALTVCDADHLAYRADVTVPAEHDPRPAAEHDVRLVRAARIGGTVRGPGGAPVCGARVTVLDGTGDVVGSAATDATGRYRVGGLRPGDYTVITRGHFPVSASLRLPSGGRTALDVRMSQFHYDM